MVLLFLWLVVGCVVFGVNPTLLIPLEFKEQVIQIMLQLGLGFVYSSYEQRVCLV